MPDLLDRLKTALADRYAIEREIGAGGMATVYLAEDLKHHRKVAVKVMRPELASAVGGERFLREIEIAAGLNHPRILPVHDSGEADGLLYYVMPFVEGESLRDRMRRHGMLAVEPALRIIQAVSSALSYAHSHGIIHRDIKPENILLVEGEPVLADFGIARLVSDATETLTATGVVLGTPQYMSPEQTTGNKEIDRRSDLYSLGCVLYEMLAGHAPFTGSTMHVMAGHTMGPVPSIREVRTEIPESVDHVLTKLLAKHPSDRFNTADELSAALEPSALERSVATSVSHRSLLRWGIAGAVGVLALVVGGRVLLPGSDQKLALWTRSIAVLPCVNLTRDSEQEYFSDGVAERLRSHLSTIPDLTVVGMNSVIPFRNTKKSTREVGGELNAGMLVRCRAGRSDSVRVEIQLIDVEADDIVWSDRFVVPPHTLSVFERDAAIRIAEAMGAILTARDSARLKAPTQSPEALDRYNRGRHSWNTGSLAGLQRALRFYREAIALDTGFAMAYAGRADAYVSLVGRWSQPPHEHFANARIAVERAIALDSALADAYAVRGRIRHRFDGDWSGAEKSFVQALTLKPSHWQAELDYAKLLSSLGRHEEAVRRARRAAGLDPLNWINSLGLGSVLYFARRYEEAVDQIEATIQLEPDKSLPHIWHGLALLELGRPDSAVVAIERAVGMMERHPSGLAPLAYVLGSTGRRGEARTILEELKKRRGNDYVSALLVALAHIGLGEADSAFAWINRGLQEGDWYLKDLAVYPMADPLRFDDRLAPILRQLRLDGVTVPTDPVSSSR